VKEEINMKENSSAQRKAAINMAKEIKHQAHESVSAKKMKIGIKKRINVMA